MKALTAEQFAELSVGGRLKVLRLRANLTQLQLAAAVGLTRNTIGSMENGLWQRLSLGKLLAIAQVLQVNCGTVLD